MVARARRDNPGQQGTGNGQLPPGIRSWSDGRVLKEATRDYQLVAIGCSMGGMHALQTIFQAAMAPDVRCWELGSDGGWTRTGERNYQTGLLHRAGEHAG